MSHQHTARGLAHPSDLNRLKGSHGRQAADNCLNGGMREDREAREKTGCNQQSMLHIGLFCSLDLMGFKLGLLHQSRFWLRA